jgi:hypothetical protein
MTGREQAPNDLREGVRSGILSALERDTELRGGRTARLLVAAGAMGIFGAIGMVLMLSSHPYGHHPPWHGIVFTAIWSGFLITALAIAFLRVSTPSLPLARAACVAIVGLGVAGVCSTLCPDQHFLIWWSETAVGGGITSTGGPALSALCFGAVTALVFGATASLVAVGSRTRVRLRPLLPALLLVALLAPGIALESFGTSWLVFAAWFLGTAVGAYAGVAIGIAARGQLAPQ